MMRKISRGRMNIPGVNHILKSITAAKYILTTLTVLSVTWLPWVATLYHDISTHHGKNIPSSDNITATLALQECVYQLLDEGLELCTQPFEHEQLFIENLQYALHSYQQDFLQMFSIMLANCNSILNPIIYAFWYPDFRKTLKLQLNRVFLNPFTYDS